MRTAALICALPLLAMPAAAQETSLGSMTPDAVAALVDATSFPSSIGPRRQDGLKTFADYGFTTVEISDRTAALYDADRSWMFAVTLLSAQGEEAVLCILDRSLDGGTYHTQDAEVFARSADGLLVATGETVVDPTCPHLGE